MEIVVTIVIPFLSGAVAAWAVYNLMEVNKVTRMMEEYKRKVAELDQSEK